MTGCKTAMVMLSANALFAAFAANISFSSEPPREAAIHGYLQEVPELKQGDVMRAIWSESYAQYRAFDENISPGAKILAIEAQLRRAGARAGGLEGHVFFARLPEGERIITIQQVEGQNHVVSPRRMDAMPVHWSPRSVPYVKMKYSDNDWGEWFQYDLKTKKFSEVGQQGIHEMLSHNKGERPVDGEISPINFPRPPVWGGDGTFYKDKHAAREAGVVQLWSPPSYGMLHQRHPGLPDKHITVEHNDVTHVYRIVTGGSFADPEAATVRHEGVTKVANVHRGHVFLTNWWKRDPNEPDRAKWPRMEQNLTSEKHVGVLPLAARHIPPHGLLYYEDGALVICRDRKYYHEEGGVRHHELWKTRLPGHLFRRYHVLPPDDRLLLVTDAMVDGVPTIHYFYVHGLPPDERHDP